MLAVVVAEAAALFLLGLLVAGLLRSHAEIMRALHDLGAGVDPDDAARPVRRGTPRPGASAPMTVAHDVVGIDRRGAAAAVAVTNTDHDTLLAFLSTGCDTCHPFWSALRRDADLPGVRILVVVADEESESAVHDLAGDDLAGDDLDVVASSAAWAAYEVPGSPHFVYVDGASGRVVGEGTGPDWPAVRSLLTQANADRATRAGARIREAAGRTVQPVEWRDNPTRIDAELLAAGIGPGHPSLTSPLEADAD